MIIFSMLHDENYLCTILVLSKFLIHACVVLLVLYVTWSCFAFLLKSWFSLLIIANYWKISFLNPNLFRFLLDSNNVW